MLKNKIAQLREILVSQATLVEKMLAKSIKGLLENNKAVLDEIISIDEKTVNRMEIQIDELCTNILALYHPEAKDLRMTLMMSKMTSDLERLGDCVVNIAESGIEILQSPIMYSYDDLNIMAEEAIEMVRDSIRAFIDEHAQLAKDVCRRDEKVDGLRDKIMRELIIIVFDEPKTIEKALHILRIANNLEKIADVSTNIAEETVFITDGFTIKHHAHDALDQSAARG
ncbi:MAG: phosphate signaling complex protein PhoU [Spirochaetaceae bacterium]|nr:MAG: phosphate signaling complex protein PhoU [Spirochaetaceae bacterium]